MIYSLMQVIGLMFVIFFGFSLNGVYLARNKKNTLIFFGLAVFPVFVFLVFMFSFVFLVAGLIGYFLFLWLSADIYGWVERRFESVVADLPFFPEGALMGIYLIGFHWFMSAFLLWRLVAG